MLINYLWQHRHRVRFGTLDWCWAWAKRLLTAPALIKTSVRQQRLRSRGAKVEDPIFLAPCRFNGKASHLTIGKDSFVGRATLHLHCPVEIGRNVVINDGVVLMTASHDLTDVNWKSVTKPIVIEDYAWIATNALILPGVRIGYAAVVGAGAVIHRDVPAYALATGNPAQIKERVRTMDLQYKPTAFLPSFRAWLAGPTS
jgi:acetyltransferase-like isoleucine patch superfamily enzyme